MKERHFILTILDYSKRFHFFNSELLVIVLTETSILQNTETRIPARFHLHYNMVHGLLILLLSNKAMSLLSDLVNLNLSDKTKQIIV